MNELHWLRVDQVGQLVSTLELRDVKHRYDRGQATEAELAAARESCIRHVIKCQDDLGFPILTDGEFRRHYFGESFSAAVTGYDVPDDPRVLYKDPDEKRPFQRAEQDFTAEGGAIYTRGPVRERLKFKRNVILEEYQAAQAIARHPVKITLISPDRISQRFAYEKSRHVYRDMDEFLADVVAIERKMIAELIAAGCRYIQIDAPGYTAYIDKKLSGEMRDRGEDPAKNMTRSIKADNDVIAGFEGVTFGIHMCRGNPRAIDPKTGKVMPQWHREGFYDSIAEELFSELKHDRILLEYDSERAGSFEPIRYIPADKIAVLGLVTTKSADLEPVDYLKRRVDEASKYLPVEQLAISPQCGFGGWRLNTITQDECWRKLERVLEAADAIWH